MAPVDDVSESSRSKSLSGLFSRRGGTVTVRASQGSHPSNCRSKNSQLRSFASELNELLQHPGSLALNRNTPSLTFVEKGFVGTHDYLAPETILGLIDDAAVGWVCFSIPPHVYYIV